MKMINLEEELNQAFTTNNLFAIAKEGYQFVYTEKAEAHDILGIIYTGSKISKCKKDDVCNIINNRKVYKKWFIDGIVELKKIQ